MIQEISPHIYDNQSFAHEIGENDIVFYFDQNKVMLKEDKGIFTAGSCTDFKDLVFCFDIDDRQIFASDIADIKGRLYPLSVFRTMEPSYLGFAGITAHQIWQWKKETKYCGCCGALMRDSISEKARVCPQCGIVMYPKISPAVIVAIVDRDRILLSHYAHSPHGKAALIAGYAEVGETLEQTVHREVLEEVGLRVKNLRYYKSQPWSFSNSLLMGFVAELDGDDAITLQESELSEAHWVSRDQLMKREVLDSLTSEMIEMFRQGKI